MKHFPEEFDSIFRYIEVISQRAEQLIRGARVRTESRATKLTLQAREDVDQGAVAWRILTQEELDARRQDMAEQFRAEMAGEEGAPEGEEQPVQDVLPTASKPAAEVAGVDDGRDEELDRLQRLLGMIGGIDPDADEDADADASADADADTDADANAAEPSDDEPSDLDESSACIERPEDPSSKTPESNQ